MPVITRNQSKRMNAQQEKVKEENVKEEDNYNCENIIQEKLLEQFTDIYNLFCENSNDIINKIDDINGSENKLKYLIYIYNYMYNMVTLLINLNEQINKNYVKNNNFININNLDNVDNITNSLSKYNILSNNNIYYQLQSINRIIPVWHKNISKIKDLIIKKNIQNKVLLEEFNTISDKIKNLVPIY